MIKSLSLNFLKGVKSEFYLLNLSFLMMEASNLNFLIMDSLNMIFLTMESLNLKFLMMESFIGFFFIA